jgi:4'-phosphopantetheinyl transferase
LSFVGRGDNQVKLRGYRIELGEIEAILARHPSVKEAAVALVGGGTEAARLVASVVYRPGREAGVSELRALVRGDLPEYMTPSQFVALEAMPLTRNGKLDRKALPLPAAVGEVAPRESYAGPATPDEEALCEIWRQVLALERVGIDDDIFELGGDSVHIFRIAARARGKPDYGSNPCKSSSIARSPRCSSAWRRSTPRRRPKRARTACRQAPIVPVTAASVPNLEVGKTAGQDQIGRTPQLRGGEIHVWTARLDVDDETLDRLKPTLAADELERARRFYFVRDYRRFVVGRGVLRDLLGRYMRAAPRSLEFSYNEFGKPSLMTVDGALHFNLSHSGELAVFAVTRGREVGVDVEEFAPARADMSIAENFFSADEIRRLHALPRSLRTQGFFNCWTRKEAYIKARGMGLSIALDSFDVSLAPGVPAAILREAEGAEAGGGGCAISISGAAMSARWPPTGLTGRIGAIDGLRTKIGALP